MKMKFLLLMALVAGTFVSCIKDQVATDLRAYGSQEFAVLSKTLDLPSEANDYMLQLPLHLGSSQVHVDKHQAALGRVLFYDKKLSKNESISCASCHLPEKAFSDGKALSDGFEGKLTKRNSLTLGSFPSFKAFYGGFVETKLFWDERAATVSEQSTQTISDPIEMGHNNLDALADGLLEVDYYKILFAKAFPEAQTSKGMSNKEKMLGAIDAFVSSIGCFNSRFDKSWEKANNPDVNFSDFTSEENKGKQLYMLNCASCHNLGPLFSNSIVTANNGLDLNYTDQGIFLNSGQAQHKGVFKVPMLRNIAVSGPYMHDGRFETLEEVVEHYNSGVQAHTNLHQKLRNADGTPKKLDFSQDDKVALVAFLKTLTDLSSVTHEKYADPFKK